MAKDLDENGASFLKQGETSQSLSLSDLFTLQDGTVTPVLRVNNITVLSFLVSTLELVKLFGKLFPYMQAANPPVRANVLHLSTQFSVPIS